MIGSIKLNLKSKAKYKSSFEEFKECIFDLLKEDIVLSMDKFIQHSNVTCLDHCIYVSYISYSICKRFGLDYCSAARGALLHDFFLYDWHKTKSKDGLHGFTHPYTALRNANNFFELNSKEQDIIVKHMWPLTLKLPKYKESLVVIFADKYCAILEILKLGSREKICREVRKFS
ncbi:uncharacterized protein BJV85_002330 [Clostridium acetobutylicum]|uniref:HD family hydrolase, diverged n=1 Tax=Clostridium acetobutylicum (strain ATCC 824 / DSM 792 / JCM 1419 / IAM 19013 / LMG 5710 / NBRC 13948 / NRRL B-527 / VKM B-1787 / 2291 / W) TaxID=272562 RepID=Q97IH4_CLOAB|nr:MULTISPECIES: HD domain-containing protein [Clostridium]AAK79633.1 HD family hydrolase, diverged [Clostridium acetobutylicum ATCC 824]ADZ20717.1 HD family hydrolase, diverged [Clostridium acetobutylicum EA 2018]AEI31936.1 HD family hydrolase [Clostridium acetobutylicum DSM 1731]AWV79930.1 HD domain-containing protein [Clostridium acetobutylicum]KHD37966.1 HD family phosphohydrolase [Clostridium acetobutylicum]